jgi:hypothetical protein
VAKPEGKRYLGRPRHKREELEWMLKKWGKRMWMRFIWFGIVTSGNTCKYGDEPHGSRKGGKFLDSLNDYKLSFMDLLKK